MPSGRLRNDAKPAMVCIANDLQEWKDFPKGLKVLLLEGDNISATEIRAKLEAMDYNVSAFCDENEALSAISSRPESFHIAIVEVSSSSSQGGFKFLENAKDLPTIMTSNNHCLNTMMKCIALGAVEFLSKPLSEDKLRNIWQHVVHKAFNAAESVLSESLKPVKESVVSMLQLHTDNKQHESRVSIDIEEISRFSDNDQEQSLGNDKYPAPSTPQLRHGTRLLDDGDCQEQTNYSADKESGETDGESKSVETTCGNLNAESTPQERMRLLDDGDCQEQTNCSTEKESGEHDGESKSVETTCGNSNAESTPEERTRLLDDGDCQMQTNCSTEKESGEHDGESKSVETTCGNLNAESTPEQRTILLDDGDCQEQTNCSTEKESGEHDGKSKSVETTCGNSNAESTPQQRECEVALTREDLDLVDAPKGESVASPHARKRKVLSDANRYTKPPNKEGVHSDSCETRANRKKMKVDWTPDLHKKFVKAVEQLGIDQAIPSRILELMKVEGLTRHNVASHLQKYRMHKRQLLPREEDRKWLNQREKSYCVQRPMMAFPPYHSNHTLPLAPVYPMWGQSGTQTAGMQIWGSPGYPMWQPTAENWHWKPFPAVHADAWGCPVLPVPPHQAPCFPYSQNMPALFNPAAVDHKFTMPQSSFEDYPAEEVVDNVVKEAINKPWLPLPLGLKPPSTDSVLAELSRQGISSIPPCSKGSYNSG